MVVGGDPIAEAKTRTLVAAGARVRVIAAELSPGLAELAAEGRVEHLGRGVRTGDLAGAVLAYVCVRDSASAAALREEAEAAHVLLNVVDMPESCTFFAPAVVDRGGLKIAIGTGGASPGLAAAMRRELEGRFGPEYATFVGILGAVRARVTRSTSRTDVLGALLDSPLLDLVRCGAQAEIDRLLATIVGADCTLATLGIVLGEAA